MSVQEAERYYETLTKAEATRFNLLVKMGLTLGKPIEGAYDYAKVVLENPKQEKEIKE